MKRLFVLCLVVLGTCRALCRADEARIPVFQSTTIAQPGHYILTRDIAGSPASGITIQANNVTLDLNGRTISQSNPAPGILVANGFSDITIRNGHVTGADPGITYVSSTTGIRIRIEKVEISNTTAGIRILGADLVTILSCRITGTTPSAGVLVQGLADSSYSGQFLDNVIEEIAGSGMDLGGLRGGLVRGNVITHFGKTDTFAYGIRLGASVGSDLGGNVVEHNTIRGGNDDVGIAVTRGPNNLLADNNTSGVGNMGIQIVSNGNRVVGNVSGGNQCGICVGNAVSRNVLERNHTENNSQFGISVNGDFNLCDGNVSEGNAQFGISFSGTGNAYRNNMLRNNMLGPISAGGATDAGGNIT